MLRMSAVGSALSGVAEWCTISFWIGANVRSDVRSVSSAPEPERGMTIGGGTLITARCNGRVAGFVFFAPESSPPSVP